MAKQSIFGRISTLLKANVNAMLDSAEDPQKMLDQLVRDFSNNIADAESAIAETIGNLRLLERDNQEDVQAAADWGNKAIAASRKGDELRTAGHDADADKFDNLAKIALQRQISAENEAKASAPHGQAACAVCRSATCDAAAPSWASSSSRRAVVDSACAMVAASRARAESSAVTTCSRRVARSAWARASAQADASS